MKVSSFSREELRHFYTNLNGARLAKARKSEILFEKGKLHMIGDINRIEFLLQKQRPDCGSKFLASRTVTD